jgi:hypothetical protein
MMLAHAGPNLCTITLATPLVDEGDEAQALLLCESKLWLLEAVVKRGYKRPPHHIPHGSVELISESVTARGLATGQAV